MSAFNRITNIFIATSDLPLSIELLQSRAPLHTEITMRNSLTVHNMQQNWTMCFVMRQVKRLLSKIGPDHNTELHLPHQNAELCRSCAVQERTMVNGNHSLNAEPGVKSSVASLRPDNDVCAAGIKAHCRAIVNP